MPRGKDNRKLRSNRNSQRSSKPVGIPSSKLKIPHREPATSNAQHRGLECYPTRVFERSSTNPRRRGEENYPLNRNRNVRDTEERTSGKSMAYTRNPDNRERLRQKFQPSQHTAKSSAQPRQQQEGNLSIGYPAKPNAERLEHTVTNEHNFDPWTRFTSNIFTKPPIPDYAQPFKQMMHELDVLIINQSSDPSTPSLWGTKVDFHLVEHPAELTNVTIDFSDTITYKGPSTSSDSPNQIVDPVSATNRPEVPTPSTSKVKSYADALRSAPKTL